MSQQSRQYIETQQISREWQLFLCAFAQEFSEKGDARDLRALMHQLGRRMALLTPVEDGSSLQALEDGVNRVWAEMNWGWVELQEQSDALLIMHYVAPLRHAFGEAAIGWTPALLEGMYAQWLEKLGMDKSLRLVQRSPEDHGRLLTFELRKVVDKAGSQGRLQSADHNK